MWPADPMLREAVADVDVVCVAFASEGHLGEVLAAAPATGRGRVIVVDHGDDRSARIAIAYGAIVVRDPANPGFGAGQNRGLALGESEYVLLLNPDLVLDPGAIRAGLAHLALHPEVAAVQGVVRSTATGLPERSQGLEVGPVHLWGRALRLRHLLAVPTVRRAARRSSLLADHVERVPAGPTVVESLAATALLVRRQALLSVGGFDPGYFLYGEDLDLCRRLRAAGWQLVALPDPWGTHVNGASSATVARREIVWWEGTLRFAARWWSGPRFALGWAAALVQATALAAGEPRMARQIVRRLLVAPIRARREGRPDPIVELR